jgi:hypothetical protein
VIYNGRPTDAVLVEAAFFSSLRLQSNPGREYSRAAPIDFQRLFLFTTVLHTE